MFTIILTNFSERESFDFKYVSDEIMLNLSLAQDYPTVFTVQGTFSCLLYIFAKFLSCYIILHDFFGGGGWGGGSGYLYLHY